MQFSTKKKHDIISSERIKKTLTKIFMEEINPLKCKIIWELICRNWYATHLLSPSLCFRESNSWSQQIIKICKAKRTKGQTNKQQYKYIDNYVLISTTVNWKAKIPLLPPRTSKKNRDASTRLWLSEKIYDSSPLLHKKETSKLVAKMHDNVQQFYD